MGFKKLKKRVKEGTLVIVKTGRFNIMSIEEYAGAGNLHTISMPIFLQSTPKMTNT
jgi:hypothetical protein